MAEPDRDCPHCPRLRQFREVNRLKFPDWHNAPVPSFGASDARLLIVGLAPGLKGANRTGRPFTGDYAGDLLYGTLLKFGFARGSYRAASDDGLTLVGCRITNAVRCLPPQNKPVGAEIASCGQFLKADIETIANLRVVLALGRIAHEAVLRAVGSRLSLHPFRHGAFHSLGANLTMADSYHCSRYNTNTKRLTTAMFHDLFDRLRQRLPSE